ncbi:hypothetical protein GCM10012286_06540 [Streptomyces lasiicapitis]|uniref:Uncharacterized protein n=1 Tax=Streptomyces lasiicapitis TaxID=1923961 RepID=A0ABQ2LL98_9ACTN|nr:hypothetical protein GCM10012286_06540 [Streptomyces lasiicapitis]
MGTDRAGTRAARTTDVGFRAPGTEEVRVPRAEKGPMPGAGKVRTPGADKDGAGSVTPR